MAGEPYIHRNDGPLRTCAASRVLRAEVLYLQIRALARRGAARCGAAAGDSPAPTVRLRKAIRATCCPGHDANRGSSRYSRGGPRRAPPSRAQTRCPPDSERGLPDAECSPRVGVMALCGRGQVQVWAHPQIGGVIHAPGGVSALQVFIGLGTCGLDGLGPPRIGQLGLGQHPTPALLEGAPSLGPGGAPGG